MAINKKTLVGKAPVELGVKDAVHVAIVSVRAGAVIEPGTGFVMDENNEARPVPKRVCIGVADPFRVGTIARGEAFWGLLNPDEVENVRHEWEHPSVSFAPPTNAVEKNKYIERHAESLHVSYEQLMEGCRSLVLDEKQLPYPGDLTKEQFEEAWDEDPYDLWYEWSNETGHEFPNYGSVCCPETEYPDCAVFSFPAN